MHQKTKNTLQNGANISFDAPPWAARAIFCPKPHNFTKNGQKNTAERFPSSSLVIVARCFCLHCSLAGRHVVRFCQSRLHRGTTGCRPTGKNRKQSVFSFPLVSFSMFFLIPSSYLLQRTQAQAGSPSHPRAAGVHTVFTSVLGRPFSCS